MIALESLFSSPLAISGLYGVAVAMLVAGVAALPRPGRGESAPGWSLYRRQRRRQAMRDSKMFRMTLPLVRALAPLAAGRRFARLRGVVSRWHSPAGSPGGYSDEELAAIAILLSLGLMGVFALCCGVLLGPVGLALAPAALPLGPMLVNTSLEARARQRRHLFSLALPYVLDLLVLTLRAGTSLKLSLEMVVKDHAGHPIGDEFGQVLVQIQMGLPRRQALSQLADRISSAETTALADSLNNAEELGWPLAETVEQLADRLNQARVLGAQEKAGAAGVMVMLPATLILVSALLLMFGPTIVRALRGELSVM